MKINTHYEVNIPRVPNFLILMEQKDKVEKIAISKVSEEELRKIGAIWTENLVMRANEQKLNPNQGEG